jgi:hypothetical protein
MDEKEQINRRDFTRNVAMLGFGGAIALFFGIKAKQASAQICMPTTCHVVYQNRTSSDCASGHSCWTQRVCCNSAGSGWVYYPWRRAYCGYC